MLQPLVLIAATAGEPMPEKLAFAIAPFRGSRRVLSGLFTWDYVGKSLVLFFSYFVAGKIGLAAPFTSWNVSPVWPPAGVALAAVLIWGKRFWPAIFLGAFVVNVTT